MLMGSVGKIAGVVVNEVIFMCVWNKIKSYKRLEDSLNNIQVLWIIHKNPIISDV
jgi:hypothetical protein